MEEGRGAKMISAKNDSHSRVEQPFELHVWKIFTSVLCENAESYRQLLLKINGIQPLRTVSFPQRLWLRTFRIRYVYILHPNGRTSGVYGPDLPEFPSSVCAFDTYICISAKYDPGDGGPSDLKKKINIFRNSYVEQSESRVRARTQGIGWGDIRCSKHPSDYLFA